MLWVSVDLHLLAIRLEVACKISSPHRSWGCRFCIEDVLSYFGMSLTNAVWNWKLFCGDIGKRPIPARNWELNAALIHLCHFPAAPVRTAGTHTIDSQDEKRVCSFSWVLKSYEGTSLAPDNIHPRLLKEVSTKTIQPPRTSLQTISLMVC